MSQRSLDDSLHSADVEALEERVMEEALARTGAQSGALFLWDAKGEALRLHFHVVAGLVVNTPDAQLRRRRDGRPNGIAFHVFDTNQPYCVNDTRQDPNYARYFLQVLSIAAVPIRYGRKPIGVLSVSAREADAFTVATVDELEVLADSAAKFLRRAQVYHASQQAGGRPFLIKGLSPQWLEVEARLERVAPTDAPVLIQGESGTGKELLASAIRFSSRRASGPFVTVNCAAIPETLLESVLFGHVRGAFTGATTHKLGEFQKADGGTLFLDELGELPLALQAKVLRAVELGEVQPLGSNAAPERVDVRLIAATHRDVAKMVREGRFRDDLYYRLSVMTLELPPLRQYKANMEVLAHVFLQQAAQRHDLPVTGISTEALVALTAYDFPGNVRELKNAMEHAVIMAAGDDILPAHLPKSIVVPTPASADPEPTTRPSLRELREQWLRPLETRYLEGLLGETDGHVGDAAKLAGVDAVTMYRLLERRGLGKKSRRRSSPA